MSVIENLSPGGRRDLFGSLEYFGPGFRAGNAVEALTALRDKKEYNERAIYNVKEMVGTLLNIFNPPITFSILPHKEMGELGTYMEIMGLSSLTNFPIINAKRTEEYFSEMKGRVERVSSSLEKITNRENVSNKELDEAIGLFEYISNRCLSLGSPPSWF
jgi:hypothetical protein